MNPLKDETSPYLLQHADNPVDWYPWGPEALELARREDRPILLSVGYSACHWCHVMAHESFENEAIAALMNRHFVNIKVDREERPDIDRIYQTAHQLIARRPGGWPLTMFLDPQTRRPFFGGTYFPDRPRYGMPGFGELLEKVAAYFRDQREDIRQHGDALTQAFARLDPDDSADALHPAPIQGARDALLAQFDPEHGGFGTAPKFPHATSLERLLRHWRATAHSSEPDTEALFACALTLTRMAEGGIYDQLGGGFCRYSVDEHWSIPHFEKMLYDNGPLLALYAQMWQVSGDELYRRIANETADWVIRDMHERDGGFYSTLDADSEGEEGRFYVWTPDQARALLPAAEYEVLAARFGLDEPPNFEGHWHLRVHRSIPDIGRDTGIGESAARALLDRARSRLLAARDGRVWPARDEKLLTSWNALMIRGLAIAARSLGRADLGLAAGHAVDYIRSHLVVDGQLLATCKDGRARFDAYLDDHAFLLDALLELLQLRWRDEDFELATWLADRLLDEFMDTQRGGFFFTGRHHEALLHRSRPMADESLPAGNAIAALALNRLGHLVGDTRYLDAAHRTLLAGYPEMAQHPHGHPALVTALEEWMNPPEIVVIRGSAEGVRDWATPLASIYAPRRLVLAIPEAARLPPGLASREARDGTVAYVCRGTACTAPIDSRDALARELATVS
jgi:uncharacterized protein YyaL (SSP411 family)